MTGTLILEWCLPGTLDRPPNAAGSTSGGGVSVSMDETAATSAFVFSVDGSGSAEGVVATSSGGGVWISGRRLTDGSSGAILSNGDRGSASGMTGRVS